MWHAVNHPHLYQSIVSISDDGYDRYDGRFEKLFSYAREYGEHLIQHSKHMRVGTTLLEFNPFQVSINVLLIMVDSGVMD